MGLPIWFFLLLFGHERCSVIAVNIVILGLSLAPRPNIYKVRHRSLLGLLLATLLVVRSLEGVQSALPCVFRLIACKTYRVQIEFIFDLTEGLLQFLCLFE